MNHKIKTVIIGTGLAAVVGLFQLVNSNEPTNIVNKGVFPPTNIIDKDNDGTADEVKYLMIGNRVTRIFTREPTEQEKTFYKDRY